MNATSPRQYGGQPPTLVHPSWLTAGIIFTIIALLLTALTTTAHAQQTLRLFAARSFVDSGVVSALIQGFRHLHPDIAVELTSLGALEVLDQAKLGKADIVITHHPMAEEQFMVDGYGSQHAQIMYSEYALVGPPNLHPELIRAESVIDALRFLAKKEEHFLTPSPRAGTYRKISELWQTAGIDPEWFGYEITGVSGLETLRQTAEAEAYTIIDMGTYLSHQAEFGNSIVPLRRGEFALRNVYSALVVSKRKVSGADENHAKVMFDYLISQNAQDLIRTYGEKTFNATFLVPAASFDQTLRLQQQRTELAEKESQLNRTRALLVAIVLTAIIVLLMFIKMHRAEKRRLSDKHAHQQVAARLELTEKAEKARSLFFANMNHELRTPLNAILGYSDLLIEAARDNKDTNYLEDLGRIKDSGKHLLTIVNDILDISKMEAGLLQLHLEDIEVNDVISQATNITAPMMSKNQNRLHTNIDQSIPRIVSDSTRLIQILVNLLSNAAKFTRNGEISLHVTRLSDKTIQFTLTDTGIGMTHEQLDRLFTPFQQAEAATAKNYGGTGLGLAICAQLVRMMRGTINIQSEPNKGTRFEIMLPTSA